MNLDKSSDALLNEYKGNLFEFLVALNLSQINKIEKKFYESVSNDYNQMLTQQEQFIRNYYPELLEQLPKFAHKLANKINKYLKHELGSVQLVGKSAAANKDVGEADLICYAGTKQSLISIKLSKDSAFVNTKSAGVKSFISKYFHDFKSSFERQNQLNAFFDKQFEEFSRKIHASCDVDYDINFENWILEALPRLPGALKGECRDYYLGFVYEVSNNISDHLVELLNEDQALFVKAILPLMGQSRDDIINAITFYKNKKNEVVSSQSVYSFDQSSFTNIQIKNNESSTSIDINLGAVILQIRVKCMNKFTSKSFKVNCAIKHL